MHLDLCTYFFVFIDAMNSLCCPVLLLCAGGASISTGFDCLVRCANVCLLVCICSQQQHNSNSAKIFFSFLFLFLCSSCSSYCHCFPILYCPAFWMRAWGSSFCTFWKCNNNNNDDDDVDDYSCGENQGRRIWKGGQQLERGDVCSLISGFGDELEDTEDVGLSSSSSCHILFLCVIVCVFVWQLPDSWWQTASV